MKITSLSARNFSLIDLSGRKNSSLIKQFLMENHLQGWARGNSTAYGLYFQEELVQIMTFGKPRYNRNFQWEIIRECSQKNTQVRGGASRLFKAFRRDHNPVSVIVYTSRKDSHQFDYQDHYVNHMEFKRLRENELHRE
jgi:hypothetical protein